MKYPKGWRPWPKRRRRFKKQWGDGTGELYDARTEYGAAVYSERTIYLHPHLQRPEHHDFRWEVIGHEVLHQIDPELSHKRIYRLERHTGQILHDLFSGCTQCEESSPSRKSSSRRR